MAVCIRVKCLLISLLGLRKDVVMEYKSGLMERFMRVIGLKTKQKEKEPSGTLKATSTLASSAQTKPVASVSTLTSMAADTKASG